MDRIDVTFSADLPDWEQFAAECKARRLIPGAVLADLMRERLARYQRENRQGKAVRSEPWLNRLKAQIDDALRKSRDWSSLRFAMDRQGIAYHPAGKGLIVIDATTGEVLCKASDVGPGYGDLVRRFGQGFPGHPKPWLAEEALAADRKASAKVA